ncbi:hypothetical protein B0H11DRAFT_2251910 [Mycena galericulata]|nr:hypothetical protein B0H11DRAFT_2251910 [Mycena galericulata]
MPLFAFTHVSAFAYTDFIDPTTTYVACMPMYYALRDVVADSHAMLRGEGIDYRAFEPSEGYMQGFHQLHPEKPCSSRKRTLTPTPHPPRTVPSSASASTFPAASPLLPPPALRLSSRPNAHPHARPHPRPIPKITLKLGRCLPPLS